jgi:hypothetical protein
MAQLLFLFVGMICLPTTRLLVSSIVVGPFVKAGMEYGVWLFDVGDGDGFIHDGPR